MKNIKLTKSPIFFGVVLAMLVALLELIFNRKIPQAYEICTICHARDLISWVVNHFVPIEMDPPDFARQAVVLTPLGLILGSFFSSKRNSEFKIVRVENPFLMILYGIVVSVFGLLIMSCPTRIILRVAFADSFGIIALLGLLAGITTAVFIFKRRV